MRTFPRLGTRAGLITCGVLLLVTALASWLLLALQHLDGYDWPDTSLVKDDGAPHAVPVSGGHAAMLWTYEASVAPDCSVTDVATGQTLDLQPTGGRYRREGGSAGDWVGTGTFVPRSDHVEVTCPPTGVQPFSLIAVEDSPRLPPVLTGVGAYVAVPLALAACGAMALIGAAVRTRRVD